MEDEIKTVEESQEVAQEAPKKRGRKPKTEEAAKPEPVVETKVKESSESDIDTVVEPENDPDPAAVNETPEETSAVIEPKSDLKPAEKSNIMTSAVVKNLRVYKTPNEKSYATTISGAIKIHGDDVNGFVPVEFKAPGQGKLFKGYSKKNDLTK